MNLCTREQMREMDRKTIEEVGISGSILMEVAGRAASHILHEHVQTVQPDAKTIAIFCGGGNNGGDGYVMARHLDTLGYDVDVLMLVPPGAIEGDAWTNLEILRRLRPTIVVLPDVVDDINPDSLQDALPYYDVYVDALLGTGLEERVRGNYRQVIHYLNEANGIKFAVDIPSGLDADTGKPLGIAFEADLTATFGLAKNGLFLEQGRDIAGDVSVVDIGLLPETQDEVGIQGDLLTEETLLEFAFPRDNRGHKGTFGHVGIVAGSDAMSGAAALSSAAAFAAGVGLTTVLTRPSVRPVVLNHCPEAMVKAVLPDVGELGEDVALDVADFLEGKTALALGPGLGQEPSVADVLGMVLRQGHRPVVIDADALNVLAENLELLEDTLCPVVLTPHPGEMARLTGVPVEQGMADPLNWASSLAQQTRSYVILKFSTTVLCAPDGRYAINSSGNPGMASGGTGDVLTGLLAGLLATGMTPWDASRFAIYAHGRAGDLAEAVVGQRSMRATHLLEYLPNALSFLD